VTWSNIGTHTFPTDTPMPGKVFLGPYFAPGLNGNNAWRIGHSVVGKIRNYGPFSSNGNAGGGGNKPTLTWSVTAGTLTLNFTGGKLQMATRLGTSADWTDVPNAASGTYTATTTSAPSQFFRVLGQ